MLFLKQLVPRHSRGGLRFSGVFCLVMVVMCTSFRTFADETNVHSDISMKHGWNDNIFLSSTNQIASQVTVLSTGVMCDTNNERLHAQVKAQGTALFYEAEKDLNSIDQKYESDLSYRVNETNTCRAIVGYSLESSPDSDLTSSGFILDTTRRNRLTTSGHWTHAYSERLSSGLVYNYANERFKSKGSSVDSDMSKHGLNMGFKYQLERAGKASWISLNMGWERFVFSSSDVDTISILPGINWYVSEKTAVSLNAGARYTQSRYQTLTPVTTAQPLIYTVTDDKEHTIGGVGLASLLFFQESSSIVLSLDHRVEPASGKGVATERTGVSFVYKKHLVGSWAWNFDASYFNNRSDKTGDNNSTVNEQTWCISPQLEYAFTRNTKIDLTYTWLMNRVLDESPDTRRQMVFLRLSHHI